MSGAFRQIRNRRSGQRCWRCFDSCQPRCLAVVRLVRKSLGEAADLRAGIPWPASCTDAQAVQSIRRFGALASLSVLAGALALVLGACAEEPPITVTDGHVKQRIDDYRAPGLQRTDFVFVVDPSSSPEASASRARAAEAFAEAVEEMRAALWGRWNPTDVRAFVVRVGEYAIRSPLDDPRLAWVEANASREGAKTFVDAVVEAMNRPSAASPAANSVAMLRFALGVIPARDASHRIGTIVTGRDDPAANPETDRVETYDSERDLSTSVHLIAPYLGDFCEDLSGASALGAWARANFVRCGRLREGRSLYHGGCPLPVARKDDGMPSCRVRALFKPTNDMPSSCDPRRGWSTSDEPALPRPSDWGDYAACEVTLLTGDEARRCKDRRDDCEGCASGYCLTDEPPGRCQEPELRFVGGAAPSDATLEIACNVP